MTASARSLAIEASRSVPWDRVPVADPANSISNYKEDDKWLSSATPLPLTCGYVDDGCCGLPNNSATFLLYHDHVRI